MQHRESQHRLHSRCSNLGCKKFICKRNVATTSHMFQRLLWSGQSSELNSPCCCMEDSAAASICFCIFLTTLLKGIAEQNLRTINTRQSSHIAASLHSMQLAGGNKTHLLNLNGPGVWKRSANLNSEVTVLTEYPTVTFKENLSGGLKWIKALLLLVMSFRPEAQKRGASQIRYVDFAAYPAPQWFPMEG